MVRVVGNISQVALSGIGIVTNAEYVALAWRTLRCSGYPVDRLEEYILSLPVTHEGANRDVNALVRLIVATQIEYADNIARAIPDLFRIKLSVRSDADSMKQVITAQCNNLAFLYYNSNVKLPFAVEIIAAAIAEHSGIHFDTKMAFRFVNHRLIAHTAVAIHHGLVSWSGGYFFPDYMGNKKLEMRQKSYKTMRSIWDRCYPPPNDFEPLIEQRTSVKVLVAMQNWVQRCQALSSGKDACIRAQQLHKRCTVSRFMAVITASEAENFDKHAMNLLKQYDVGCQPTNTVVFGPKSDQAVNEEVAIRGANFTANSPDPDL